MVVLYLAGGFGTNDNNSFFIFLDLNSYHEANLLYGREFDINDWFKLEGQIGVGTFYQNNSIIEEKNTIGLPIRAKFLLYPFKKFGIGYNLNHNINCINNITSYNLILQFKF